MRTKQEILKSHAEECSRRAALATGPLVRYDFSNLAAQWLEMAAIQQELEPRRELSDAWRAAKYRPTF